MSAKPWTAAMLLEHVLSGSDYGSDVFKLIDGEVYLIDDLATCAGRWCPDSKVHQDDLDDEGLCLNCTRDPYHDAPKCSRVDNG